MLHWNICPQLRNHSTEGFHTYIAPTKLPISVWCRLSWEGNLYALLFSLARIHLEANIGWWMTLTETSSVQYSLQDEENIGWKSYTKQLVEFLKIQVHSSFKKATVRQCTHSPLSQGHVPRKETQMGKSEDMWEGGWISQIRSKQKHI